MNLHERSDQELLSDVATLVGSHRELTAKLVAHLAEIEERRLHLLAGYSSMFDFCRQKLGMSEGEAFRRILAARLSRRFPPLLSLLASGSVNLTTLELVRDYLTDENHVELLAAVAGTPKREVMEYLAGRFARPDKPSRIQRLATMEPLSEGRFKVEFTASKALCEKLELCRDLMSHANPGRDLAVVMERAVDLLLRDLERKRLGRTRRRARLPSEPVERGEQPSRESGGRATSSRIATRVKREVFERDGVRCTFVAGDGRRCEERAFLELDHIDPKAHGGANDTANLRVRCRAHNQLWAEQAFGRVHMDHFRQKKSKARVCDERDIRHRSDTREMGTNALFEKVRLALTSMGFRNDQARRAVAEVMRAHDTTGPLALEQTLREALLVATAAWPTGRSFGGGGDRRFGAVPPRTGCVGMALEGRSFARLTTSTSRGRRPSARCRRFS